MAFGETKIRWEAAVKVEGGKVVQKPAPRGRRLRLKRRRLQCQRPHRPRLFRVLWFWDVGGLNKV